MGAETIILRRGIVNALTGVGMRQGYLLGKWAKAFVKYPRPGGGDGAAQTSPLYRQHDRCEPPSAGTVSVCYGLAYDFFRFVRRFHKCLLADLGYGFGVAEFVEDAEHLFC
jgi:hypothetical protein